MPEFILNAGLELPFILILLALLGFRRTVHPRAWVMVKAPLEKVFLLVDLHDGKVQNWNRTTVTSNLIDPTRQIFRMTYVTTLSTGSQQSSQADFRVVERRDPNYLELAHLSRFAELLGDAYQLSDDLIDLEEDGAIFSENKTFAINQGQTSAQMKLKNIIEEAKRVLIDNFSPSEARSCLIQLTDYLAERKN